MIPFKVLDYYILNASDTQMSNKYYLKKEGSNKNIPSVKFYLFLETQKIVSISVCQLKFWWLGSLLNWYPPNRLNIWEGYMFLVHTKSHKGHPISGLWHKRLINYVSAFGAQNTKGDMWHHIRLDMSVRFLNLVNVDFIESYI